MLIDEFLPRYEVREVQDVEVDAPVAETFDAIRRADLRDPLIRALFAIRELPNRVARRLRGEPPPPEPASFTFADVATPEMGWVPLAEEPGTEFVVGAVGRFWRRDYGWHAVAPETFAAFAEPGFAKLAVGFSVCPLGLDRALLRYEARTATTDDESHRYFRRYWRVIHPGVALVMHRALRHIKDEAERQAAERVATA